MRRFGGKSGRGAALLAVSLALIVSAIVVFEVSGVPGIAKRGVALEPTYPLRVELAPRIEAERHHPAVVGSETPGGLASDVEASQGPAEEAVASQFGDKPRPAARADETAGLLAVDFDLSPDTGDEPASGGEQLQLAKPLKVNGREAGKVGLMVGRHSRLFLDRADLVRALRDFDEALAQRVPTGAQPFVSFDELRASGIAVRYDPVADGVRLES